MLTVLTGLLASFSYASSDMFSQRVTRETRPLTQMVWVLVTGVVIILPVALLVRGLPHAGEWQGAGLAALAGALYFGALFCLLHGLQIGDLAGQLLALARALYRCGDFDGVAEKVLKQYALDLRGVYALHATAVLKSGKK